MRVLHVSSLYPPGVVGGAEKVVSMLAEGQAAQGATVGVTHLTREGGDQRLQGGVQVSPLRSRNLLWIEDVQAHSRPVTIANKLLQQVNLWAAADIAREIADFAPDVVHTHSMVELPPMVWRAAKRRGAAVVHTLHDYDLLCSRATLFKHGRPCERLHPSCTALKAWKGLFAGDIDAVVAVSQPVLDTHLDHGLFRDLRPDRRRVIWNGVARRTEAEPAPRTGVFTFGFLGRLVPEKGLGVLLDACRLLSPEGWQLRIAGRAPLGSEGFEAQAEGLPVEFLGFTDPATFLASVDVLVAPSIWAEPFGLTIVEAFAAGAAVIGSDRGAIGELAGAIGSRWVVPADDAAALADRMRAVLEGGRAALPAPDAFEPILQAASPERMTAAYLDLYAELGARQVAPVALRRRVRFAPSRSADAYPAP